MIPLAFKSYNVAQTFQVDPSQVKNSTEVGISRVDLYFRAKPPSENNKSGILNPGVEVTIIPCINGVPDTNSISSIRPTEPSEHGSRFTFDSSNSIARKEWGEIIASTDSSSVTVFRFKAPIFVKTGQEYAVAVKFDGNEDFIIWDNKKGNLLVNSTNKSPGNSRPFIGNLFKFISPIQPFITPQIGTTTTQAIEIAKQRTSGNIVSGLNQSQDSTYSNSNWKPIADTTLKFKLYFARYSHNGIPIFTNNTITSDPTITTSLQLNPNNANLSFNNGVISVIAQSEKNEYITYDNKTSNFILGNYGETVYQVAPFYPGGTNTPLTVSVVSGASRSGFRIVANASYSLPNGSFNSVGGFNNIFSSNGNDDEYIIVKSGNVTNVRKITEIVSNTEITVDEPFTFTNNAAYFFKSPVGKIKSLERTFIDGKGVYLLTLYSSNANDSVRFVNNAITSITVTANGSGYSNTDYIRINGYENGNGIVGGYSATANIVTNGTGNVVSILVSNNGTGFINASSALANYQVLNSSASEVLTLVANGLTFDVSIDSRLETEFNSNNYFSRCKVINFDSMRGKPEITINNPLGTNYSIRHRHLFYKKPANNSSNWSYHILPNQSSSETYLKIFKSQILADYSNSFVIPSRSNQFVATYEANNSVGNTSILGVRGSNTSVMIFDVTSNNDYSSVFVDPDVCRIHFSAYTINDDYTNEHTNYGNAFSKHITTKVNFTQDRFAEDLLVYLTAYRPLGTDLKIYARIHNSNDPEAFDDKDWTLLEEIEGNGIYSSKDDPSDYIELGYNFTAYPNTELTTDGSVTVIQGNTLVSGSNTSFTSGTSNLVSNDLVKIYNPLFQNNYFIAVVNNVINSTAFHIKRSVGELSSNAVGSTVSITSDSSSITGTSTKFLSDFANGNFIAVWANSTVYEVREINRVISDTSMNVTSSFTSTNSTSVYATVDPSNILNFSLAGSGLKLDKLQYPHQAFNNKANDNVVRYYSSSMVEFDTFNTFQLKIVMLSNNSYLVPKVDDVRAIGVSS